jgi:hypothetical protein
MDAREYKKRSCEQPNDDGCFRMVGGLQAKRPATETDALLAKELNELSLDEREKVYEDIHGIPRLVEEEPVFVDKALDGLEEALSKIPKKVAYNQALFLSPTYVQDPKFRLMFLRAELFHVERAASRVVSYFEQKLELFGIDKLGRDIRYEDLDDDDRAAVMTGALQILPEKDRSGRLIAWGCLKDQKYRHWKNQVRTARRGLAARGRFRKTTSLTKLST